MTNPAAPARRRLALGLISAALLADQIVLMQLLATSQWHHFAYLVISVALLGFGAAGSLLAIARERLLAAQNRLLPLLMTGCALSMVAPLGVAQALFGGFDSYLVFVAADEALRLAGVALLLMLPFACGALAIGLIFAAETGRIGGYYAANLVGSGFGCLLGLTGLDRLPPEMLPPIWAMLSVAAAVSLRPRQRTVLFGILLTAAIAGLALWRPPAIRLSQYKDLRRALELPGAEVLGHTPSAAGQVHLVGSPILRYAPGGVSLQWRGTAPARPVVFINGNQVGSVPPPVGTEDALAATTGALAYALGRPQKVLVLDAGTGDEVKRALARQVERVTAIEPHRHMTALLDRTAPAFFGIHHARRVDWHALSARSWLARDPETYHLIVLPMVGSVGGEAGLYALQEQPLLTRQAIEDAWRHLAPGGFLSVSTWIDYPVRRPLRLLATLLAAMRAAGVAAPAAQIAAVRGWGTVTFCLKNAPLSDGEIEAALRFAADWGFDPLMLPGWVPDRRQARHRLQDDSLLELVDTLLSPRAPDLLRAYPFRLTPPTDDRPFFDQFLRWGQLGELATLYGNRGLPFLEIGLLVAVVAAAILSGLAAVLILAPLACLPRGSGRKCGTLLYFGGLGIGYMWVEMSLVHRFSLYLDHPVRAAALVICALLVGSGCGSLLSSRCRSQGPVPWSGLVAVGILFFTLLLDPALTATRQLAPEIRMLFGAALVFPLAVLMGLPFPLGLRRLAALSPAEVPWAWGINGCLSVVGAALATLLAVEVGFTSLLLLAVAAYLLPVLARLA